MNNINEAISEIVLYFDVIYYIYWFNQLNSEFY